MGDRTEIETGLIKVGKHLQRRIRWVGYLALLITGFIAGIKFAQFAATICAR